jgi:hypothetical protein
MTIYLYKKTHRVTGLKYLGKTTAKDPYKYQGSGVYWTNHIKKHGYDCDTEILKECSSKEELREFGLYYSNLWNVVESDEWANLREEKGDGGWGYFGGDKHPFYGKKRPEHSKTLSGRKRPNHSQLMLGNPSRKGMSNSEESNLRRQIVCSGENSPRYGLKDPSYSCIHCGKTVSGLGNLNRWHNDNCKLKIS